MERKSNYEVGDLIRYKSPNSYPIFYEIIGFATENNITVAKLISYFNRATTEYPVLLMDSKFINYGKNKQKVIDVLYGAKSKNNSK